MTASSQYLRGRVIILGDGRKLSSDAEVAKLVKGRGCDDWALAQAGDLPAPPGFLDSQWFLLVFKKGALVRAVPVEVKT